MPKLQLVIVGARGRMGTRIAELARRLPRVSVAAKLDTDTRPEEMRPGHVIIDFSEAKGSLMHLKEAVRQKKPYVLGTTGFSMTQEKEIARASRQIPVVRSSNMSLGVNLFFQAGEMLAQGLRNYAVRIEETHHVHKKDAPSGTALQAGKLIAKAGGQRVTYKSYREGDVIGDHRLIFTGPMDTIEIVHHAKSRDIFAAGAILAAEWVVKKKAPGLYTMQHVLGLS